MNLNKLRPTQDGLRNYAALDEMIGFVKSGGRFTRDIIARYAGNLRAPLIGVTRFEDGTYAVHDGHHRIASIWLSGRRDFLYEDEYFVKDMSYDYYNELGFENGWVTPFDPRTHVRIPDFGPFKAKALRLYAEDREAAIRFVRSNSDMYLVPRDDKHQHISGIVSDIWTPSISIPLHTLYTESNS